jgi:hypothetical protein
MRITFLGNFAVPYSSETHHAASLEALGHTVHRFQESFFESAAVTESALQSDLFVWIHTHGWATPGVESLLHMLRHNRIPSLTYHLDLWFGLQRQRDIRSGPYWELDHFFTVDRNMADWLTENTPVKGHFLPAGVFDQECYMAAEPSPHANDVIFVGARNYHPEWPWRPELIDWLRHTYGPRFTHVGGDGDTGTLRGDELNRVYAHSKVAVGDTLCLGFDYPWYTSDRLFEAPGRGGFQLFPRIHGVDEWFTDGETIRFFDFGDFDGLKALIDHYLEDEAERERIRAQAHQHVKNHHTYLNRWQTILETL